MAEGPVTWTSVFAGTEKAPERRLSLKKPTRSTDEAREFGGWTVDKLEVLRLYFAVYKRVAGNGTYIDAFAGTGQVKVGETIHQGSASIALSSGAFKEFHFYERPSTARRLQRWIDESIDEKLRSRLTIVPGDVNETLVRDLDRGRVNKDKPCFAFLDPTSTQLNWSTIQELAAYKAECDPPKTCKVELWILFNTDHALMRLMPRTGQPPFADVLNRWIGDEKGWRDLYEQERGPRAFVDRYADRLMQICGYGLARSLPIRDPQTGRRQYFMVHASDHPTAHDFMRWAARKAYPDSSEAISLPGFGETS